MKKIILAALIVIYIWLGWHFKPWDAVLGKPNLTDIFLAVTAVLTLAGLIISCGRMIAGSESARTFFLFFNSAFLLFGFYVSYISWTLWIFQTPTILDRIKATAAPLIIGIIMPLGLFYYFRRKP